MTDETHVTDNQGPSLDDLADVAARTNRGILALSEELTNLKTFLVMAFVVITSLLFRLLHRVSV